jgi:hypothetical protein
MKTSEKIFWDLYKANSQQEVSDVINKYSELKDQKNWLPYGGNKGNFGTFESQQNHPVPALIEKITNSTDAILIKDCRLHGIDPKSKDAPKSMDQAVEEFYKIKDGQIGELSANARRLLAENIQVIALGDKKVPSIVIYDNGEGQHPDHFKDSFLSLHQSNKTNIHFVQGKYNMGSTGAVTFCGDKKFQLIASKRNALLSIADKIPVKDNLFGFTLVRRHELTKKEESEYGKSTWYEYLAIEGNIPSFPITAIDLGLYNRKFTTGSYIKLYSYELPKGSRSNITLDLWRDLNQFMYHLPLPIALYEKRDYISKNPTKILLGNKTRVTIDSRDSVEHIISFKIPKETGLGDIPVSVIIFKPNVDHNEFIKNKSIIYTQNGQVHGFEGQSFISQDLGFSLLKRHALIHVNCTDVPTSVRQDLFMANRTHLKNSTRADELRTEIVNLLRKSDELKRINNQIKQSLLQDSEGDSDLLETMLSKLPVDKDVISLLKKDGALNFLKQQGGLNKNGQGIKEATKLNRFPSIFKLNLKKNGDNDKVYRTIPIKTSGTVTIDTDVDNDYFFRPNDPGKLDVEVLRKLKLDDEPMNSLVQANENARATSDILAVSVEGPVGGVIKLIMNPTEKAKVGDEVEVRATLTSEGGRKLSCVFDVKVDAEISKPKHTEKKPTETFPTLPTPRKAYQHTDDTNGLLWSSPELNWTGQDIVKIITSTDSKSELMVSGIIVNMDSFVLKNFFSKNRINSEADIKFNKDKYFLSIYLHSLFLFSILQKMRRNDDKLKGIEVDDFVSSMIKPYSDFLMYENHHITKMAFKE